MKRVVPVVLTLLLSIGSGLRGQNLQTQPPPTVPTLQNGTPVRLRLNETLSSDSVTVGQTVGFEVLDNVKVGEITVIPKGGGAWATVSDVQSSRSMGRGGKLDINIDGVSLADGKKVALRAVRNTKGGGHVGAMTGAMVATSLVFWPATPLFLFIHGKDTTIPEGTEIVAYVNGDVPLDLRKFTHQVLESTLDIQANRRVAVGAASSQRVEDPNVVVEFISIPTGADVSIDGNYVGSTPSSITVAAGEHTIRVAKPDYRPYQRIMTVVPGHPRVAATLEIQKSTGSLSHYQ